MKVRFAAPALCLFLLGSASATFATAQYQQQGPPPPPPGNGYGQGQGYGPGGPGGPGGWDAPPQEYSDVQRQGFHDGMRAAHQDFDAQQRPSPMQHMEFRHPQVPPPARNDYRQAFRKGYFMAMHHMQGGGPGSPR